MLEFIINPAGGAGQTMVLWNRVEKILQEKAVPYQAVFSTPSKGITDIVRELTSAGSEKNIVIVGGDGSMNEAVNGIADFEKTNVGFISCGSGNDLARSMKLVSDPEKVIDVLAREAVVRRLDVGEVRWTDDGGQEHMRRFNISSGVGFDAEICEEAERSRFKELLNKMSVGKLIYIVTAVRVIFQAKWIPAVLKTDDREIHADRLLFAAAMNQPYEGGGFRFGPDASPTDGTLDVCIAAGLKQKDFFRIFPYAYSGRHVEFDGVDVLQTRHFSIECESPMWLHTDGEICAEVTNADFRIIENKMRFIM